MTNKRVRCALYTRKSSEEGLEQSFNSLEAQREACESFVLSQRHEGWAILKDRYDDGGFSGGTMERPGLQQILTDISAGKIDTVIVYKVDRLTRSLADFAKIIEVFDSHHVSFVSVTQQFNTTTSMGRLTLNVLLSFAQFEREVTGERIRDKVAASKKKGMWMGGVVPLGYDCIDRRLIVNQSEANAVRTIFEQYLRLGCVRKLRDYLSGEKAHSKLRTSSAGRTSGGRPYSRGALYHLLRNRVYIGQIVHRGAFYSGQHEPITEQQLWEQVQTKLETNRRSHRARKPPGAPSLLCGILFDTEGVRLTPMQTTKNGKRYRYYVSQSAIQKTSNAPVLSRIPAGQIETLVSAQIHKLLSCPDKFISSSEATPETDLVAQRALSLANDWHQLGNTKQHEFIRAVTERVTLGQATIWVEVDTTRLLDNLLQRKPEPGEVEEDSGKAITITADFIRIRRGTAVRLIGSGDAGSKSDPIPSLVKAVARARCWYERILAGEPVRDIAQRSDLSCAYVNRILQLAILSPQLTSHLMSGNHRADLTLETLIRKLPIDWNEQSKYISSNHLRSGDPPGGF